MGFFTVPHDVGQLLDRDAFQIQGHGSAVLSMSDDRQTSIGSDRTGTGEGRAD